MIRRFYQYSFLIPLVLFIVHQFMEVFLNIHIRFLDNYLDPFCMSALGLHLLAAERQWFFNDKLRLIDVVVATLFLAFFAEVVFPYFSSRFTTDIYDVLAIAAGSVWFVFTSKDQIVR